MRSGILVVLVVFLASIACSQRLRFVYPVPAPADFTQRNLVYKQSSRPGCLWTFFSQPTPLARSHCPCSQFSTVLVVGSCELRRNLKAGRKPRPHMGSQRSWQRLPPTTPPKTLTRLPYLRQHAEDLGIDPERLVVIAWSGNVSAGLPAVEDTQRKAIKAAVIYYGSADVSQVRLDLPVLFVRAGLDQPLTNQSFDRRIAAGIAANAPWTVVNYPGGHDGFDVLDDNELSREVIEETFRFAQLAISGSHQSALHGGLAEASAAGAMFTEDFARAGALYHELVVAHPQDARLLLAYGNALSGAKQYKEARAQFDRAKVIGGPRRAGSRLTCGQGVCARP